MSPRRDSVLLGLVGAGIGASLTPALHEREGREQGLTVAYRPIDLVEQGLDVADLGDILRWATHLGFDGLNVTHPYKQAVIPLLDGLSPAAEGLGAVNTVVIRDGLSIGHNTDASGFLRGLQRQLPNALTERMVLLGAGGAGSAIGYAVLQGGAEHLTVVDVDAARRTELATRLADLFGAHRVSSTHDVAAALRSAGGLIHATPTGTATHPGLPLSAALLRPDLWVAEIVYFPLETELVRTARALGASVVDGGGMAVYQAVGAFELFTGLAPDDDRMLAHFRSLVGAPAASPV